MYRKELVVNNKSGLHARPASELVALCKNYDSDVIIHLNEKNINAKSIISVLTGGVVKGSGIVLEVSGPDEEKAGESISAFIESLTE